MEFVLDRENSSEEEVWAELPGVCSVYVKVADIGNGKSEVSLSVSTLFSEEEPISASFEVERLGIPEIHLKPKQLVTLPGYLLVYAGPLHSVQLKHEPGEGVVVDLVVGGEVQEELGCAAYDAFDPDEQEEGA